VIRVLRGQLAADLVVVAAVVAVLVGLTTAWPRALDRMVREDLTARTTDLAPPRRDLAPAWPSTMFDQDAVPDDAEQVFADITASLDSWIATAGPELTSVLGPTEFEARRPEAPVELGPRSEGISRMALALAVTPDLDDLQLVEGAWPAAPDAGTATESLRVDVVVSTQTAQWMGWQVGEDRTSGAGTFGRPFVAHLTGLVEPVDPDADLWQHRAGAIEPQVDRDDIAGWMVHGVAYPDPQAAGLLTEGPGIEVNGWYPVDAEAVGESDRQALAAEIEGIRATGTVYTELGPVITDTDTREGSARALLGVLIAGLVGVAAGALWLAATIAVERRREGLVLLRARGASSTQLGALVGAQAALAAVPGAALGVLVALQVPGRSHAGDFVLPAVLTLGAVLLVVTAGAQVHAGRAHRGGRWRWVAEVLVVVAAVASLTVDPGSGTDPLAVLRPVLVAVAAALLALRVVPLPARLALRSTRRSLGSFLGVARAARLPVAGVATVTALTLGVATAVLAVSTVSTVSGSTQRTAERSVGADVRLDLTWSARGNGLGAEQIDTVRSTPGVASLVAVGEAGTVTVRQERARASAEVLVVDGADLARVQRDLAEGLTDLAGPGDGGPTAVVATGLPDGALTLEAPDGEIAVEARTASRVPGITPRSGWLVLDQDTWESAGGTSVVRRLLVDLEPGADPGTVTAAVLDRLEDEPLGVTTSEDVVAAVADSVLVAAGAAVLLVALALALLLVVGAPARGRDAALLATLGAPPRVHRRLVVAEVSVPAVTAAVAGALTGVLLAVVVLGGVDLRPFTGAATGPSVVLDPVLLGGVAGALVLVAAAGVLVAVRASRRVRPVAVLREGGR
jgi:putative ABC transport system permease protein